MRFDGLELIERDVRDCILKDLNRSGILYRLFSRVKSGDSMSEKIVRKGYEGSGRLIQDLIGIRITTYFEDDVDLLIEYLGSRLGQVALEIDRLNVGEFRPVRKNMICNLGPNEASVLRALQERYPDTFKHVDQTYEIQFRTTLSEGWHEVEHNMRYKCKDEWTDFDDESRLLNGIYASLELGDNTLRQMFERMAYQNYRAGNLIGMVRNKFRLHFSMVQVRPEVISCCQQDATLLKDLYAKVDRRDLLRRLLGSGLQMAPSLENFILLANHMYIHDARLSSLTPDILRDDFDHYLPC